MPQGAVAGPGYLRPLALHAGIESGRLVAAGLARPILGGSFATSLVERIALQGEVIVRQIVHGQELADLDLSRFERPRPAFEQGAQIMGIVNVTPDSFSDGGLHDSTEAAVIHARALRAAGADIIDVGGESTRPGAVEVPVAEELRRVLPVVEALAADGAMVSIDTRKAAVMRAAVAAGAGIINDVSGLTFDPDSPAAAAASAARVVIMHMQGRPADMNIAPRYAHCALEVHDWLAGRLATLAAQGIASDRVILDPGLCFGKHEPENLDLLRHLAMFHGLGCPLLIGASRKGWTAAIEAAGPPAARFPGSLVAAQWALGQGVQLLRVHDVAETRQAMLAWRALTNVAIASR